MRILVHIVLMWGDGWVVVCSVWVCRVFGPVAFRGVWLDSWGLGFLVLGFWVWRALRGFSAELFVPFVCCVRSFCLVCLGCVVCSIFWVCGVRSFFVACRSCGV